MKNEYTIPETERENVLKILNRYSKKATAYGCPLTYEASQPFATEVQLYEQTSGVSRFVKSVMVEVFSLTIDGDVICKGGYEVVARIEHLDEGNVVYPLGDESEVKLAWKTMKPHCEHCGCNRGQKATYIVRDEEGVEKQVGSTCLKDYCGIDPQRIGILNHIESMCINLDIDRYDFERNPIPHAYKTLPTLALAIRLQKEFGHVKSDRSDSNKEKLKQLVLDGERPSDKELAEAEELANAIVELNLSEACRHLLDNILVLLKSGYCKLSHFGYIAYAPLAFERYKIKKQQEAELEELKKAEREAERKSAYVGKIGERITIEVACVRCLTSWEDDRGITYLYKIIDVEGNVFIWYASRKITEVTKLKATIKNHSERDGIKQTIVTRCSVIAA